MKKEDIKQKIQKPKKEAKKPKKIARIIIILILLGIAGYVGYSVYSYMKSPGGTRVICGEEVGYDDYKDRHYRIYRKCESRPAFDGWRVLPIRTEEEYNLGLIGGEGMQLHHGIARSRYNPDIIYLSHDGGQVWKSKDGGETWEKPLGINLFLPNGQSIEVDPIDPDIVFFVVDQWWGKGKEEFEGLYKSEDGGDSWKHVKKMDPGVQLRYQHSLTYDPTSISATVKRAMTWYVAAHSDGLFRSDDGGDTWSESLGLTQESEKITTIYEIECHPTDGKTVYAGTSRGLYRSNNKGSGMAPCGNLPEGHVSSVETNPKEPNMIYVTVRGDGLYRSINDGDTFLEVKDFSAARVFINPGFPDVIYLVGLGPKTIISHDAGKTWITDIASLSKTGKRITGWGSRIGGGAGMAPNPKDPNEAVGYSEAKIWKTEDGGRHFKNSSTLFTGYYWNTNDGIAFDLNNPDRFATFNGDIGVMFTNNSGDYFEHRNGRVWYWYDDGLTYGHHAFAGDIQPIPGSEIMVASVGDWRHRLQLMRTTDEGKNWELITDKTQAGVHFFIAFNPNDPNIVYAGGKISNDTGKTFTKVDFGEFGGGLIVAMSLSNPDTIYATAKYIQVLLRSDDRGKTWYKCYSTPWGKPVPVWKMWLIEVDPKNPDIVYTVSYKYSYKNKGMERDLIRGIWNGQNMSWERLGLLDRVIDSLDGTPLDSLDKLPLNVTKIVIDPNHPEIIYAGVGGLSGVSHIWRSIDSGKSWEDITYNLPRQGVGGMAINPHSGELMIGSFYGTWIFPPPYESKNLIYNKAVSRPSGYHGLKKWR